MNPAMNPSASSKKRLSVPNRRWLPVASCVLVVGLVGMIVTGPIVRFWRLISVEEPLAEAVRRGDAQGVDHSLAAGADINGGHQLALMGGTPLMWATQNNDLAMMKLLISRGARTKVRWGGATALHWARSPEAARLLLQHGADINAKTDRGETPLAIATGWGNKRLIAFLQRSGAK